MVVLSDKPLSGEATTVSTNNLLTVSLPPSFVCATNQNRHTMQATFFPKEAAPNFENCLNKQKNISKTE